MSYIGNDGSDVKGEQPKFIRQRRNLVLISLFIIFYKVGNLELTVVNFLGNETKIGNPEIVTFALGVFFVYFLWRYYTICREVGGVRSFWSLCTSWAEDKTQRYVERKEFPNKKVDFNRVDLIQRNVASRTYRTTKNESGSIVEDRRITVRYYYSLMKVLSVVPTIVRTSSFSEYVLPYLIAVIAILEFTSFGIVESVMGLTNNIMSHGLIKHDLPSVEVESIIKQLPKEVKSSSSINEQCMFGYSTICVSKELLIGLIISLITGLVTGIVSSVIVTRLSRFENLRSEAQRILRSVMYMEENGRANITSEKPNTNTLTNIASDFYALGHMKAGESINQVIANINTTFQTPPNYEEMSLRDQNWQRASRELKPNWKSIVALKSKKR